MEADFSTIFEDERHDRSLLLLLSITDSDKLKQRKITFYEKNKMKNLALEKLHRQSVLKAYVAVSIKV